MNKEATYQLPGKNWTDAVRMAAKNSQESVLAAYDLYHDDRDAEADKQLEEAIVLLTILKLEAENGLASEAKQAADRRN